MRKDTSANGWEGWVHKQGSLVPSWKKRYLVLTGRTITYYDREIKDRKAKVKGSFELAGVQSNKDINNGMTLHGTDGKVMNIYTKTIGEFVMCKNALENAVAVKPERMDYQQSQPYPPMDYRANNISSRSDRSSDPMSEHRGSDMRSPPYQNQYALKSQPSGEYKQNQYALRSQASGEYQNQYALRSQASGEYHNQYQQQRSQYQQKPSYSGWLEKEGELVKSWKRRYFVLNGLDIAYFDNVGGSQKGGGRVTDVQVNENGLQFHLDNNRILNVLADNQDDLQGWYGAVSQALGRPVIDIRRKSAYGSNQTYAGAGAQFRRQSSTNQYGGTGYTAGSSPPSQFHNQQQSNNLEAYNQRSPAQFVEKPNEPKLQAFLDKYMPEPPVTEPTFETGVPPMADQAVASMTTSIVADFSSEFELNDLASPQPKPLMTENAEQKGQGLWLQRGGSTYIPDENAVKTVLPTRSHIATDIPPPVAKAPIVRTTSSDDLKNKLWVAPASSPVGNNATTEEKVAPVTRFGVPLPGMTTPEPTKPLESPVAAPSSPAKEVIKPIIAEPEVTEAPSASSGLWIQKGGSTYVPDDTKVPTVIPTRSHIAPDIPPPVLKTPIVRTTSSDDLKKKLWVAPPVPSVASDSDNKKRFGVPLPGMASDASTVPESVAKANQVKSTDSSSGFVAKIQEPVPEAIVEPKSAPEVVETSTNASGLWIQKGGSTYVPDESKVPTVMPTRSHIATDIPPPVAKAPYVRTTSSDDLKKKLWVEPSKIPAPEVNEVIPAPTEMSKSSPSPVKEVKSPVKKEKVEPVPPTNVANEAAVESSGLWIQKGGATYVPDESKVPTVLPTRSHIATDIPPPPKIKEPIVRTTSSDDLKKKLWVAPPKTEAIPTTEEAEPTSTTEASKPKKRALRGMGASAPTVVTTTSAPVVDEIANPVVYDDMQLTQPVVEVVPEIVQAEVKAEIVNEPSVSEPEVTKVFSDAISEDPSSDDDTKSKSKANAAPKGCCIIM